MDNSYNLGKYEYNTWTIKLAGTLFLAGLVYAIATRKSILGIVAISFLGSAVGYSIGALIKAPKRVEE